MVHRLAGTGVDRAHDRDRPPGRVRPRPVSVPRAEPRERARRRPVRSSDGRRRARVPRDPAGRGRTRMGADPRGARVLQRRGRRADRRHVLGEPRSRSVRSRGDARCVAVRAVPRDHGAAPRSRARSRSRDRLPLLVHVVRDRPDPRWAAVRDARNRDLQPGDPPVRPASGRRPLARPARVRRRRRLRRDPARAPAHGDRSGCVRSARPCVGPGRRATSSSSR